MDKIVEFSDTLLGYIMFAGAIFACITVIWYMLHCLRNIFVFKEDVKEVIFEDIVRPVLILAMILSGDIACIVINLLIHFLGWMWKILL